jgi:DNA uptake protein ComE-like DNA-binding protein
MRFYESHFWYNKSQRNGILILAALITFIQIILYFTDELFAPPERAYNEDMLSEIERKLDSLQNEGSDDNRFQIYPFNPNFISDYKGYLLGMSPEEIDRLLAFREQGRFVGSAKEFQKVTGLSDSLLERISVHFKFPKFERTAFRTAADTKNTVLKKKDLNEASIEDLKKVRGIGPVLAKRIISYRTLLGGFSFEDQLAEVYHLPEEAIENLQREFEIQEPPRIKRLNINTASFKQILDLPYIDYELTRRIMAFRSEEKIITDLSDLKKIDSFPLDKYDRIAVYLLAE